MNLTPTQLSTLKTFVDGDSALTALYSAGLFSGEDRAVINGDTLNVSYTASL